MKGGQKTNKDRLRTVLFINIAVFIAEVLAGYSSGSLSMISDSFHVFLHVFASLVALVSEYEFFDISPEKIKLSSAIINIILFFPLAYMIVFEASSRLNNPPTINLNLTYFLVAILGLAANIYTVLILKPKNQAYGAKNKNVWILRIHMIFDTIGSVIVIIGAVEIIRTGRYLIDPISSLILAGIIVLAAIWMSWELFHGHSH